MASIDHSSPTQAYAPLRHRHATLRRVAIAGAIVVWGGLLGGAAVILNDFEQTGSAPARLPQSRPDLASSRPIVRMFAHPRCPCTHASIEELAHLVAQHPHDAHYEVWFFRPLTEPDAWAHSALWNAAALIPGVSAFTDPDGSEARRAGAETSGEVVILDAAGSPVYAGGITISRGHEGDNPGLDAASGWLDRLAASSTHGAHAETALPSVAPVFGCTIHNPCPPPRPQPTE